MTRRAGAAASANARGFTLIETMAVAAVIALLCVIAYPSYQSYLRRMHRASVQSVMLDLANREQQYQLDKRTFLGGASAITTLKPEGVPAEVSGNYDLTITANAGPPPAFEIRATPKSGTLVAGEAAFTLDQDATKLPAGKWEGR